MTKRTYQDAGVDTTRSEELIQRIRRKVERQYGQRVLSGIGGFAALYDIGGQRYLAASTDGVGTKLLVAQKLGIHNTIGIDLVAMCANDILCTGARGLFFMDYLATGKLDLTIAEEIVSGIIEGCRQAELALVGGETAEMPGMYPAGQYDLAGFAVGEVSKEMLIDGRRIQDGDSIIGLASSGIHANGLSLARMLGTEEEIDYWKELLKPTRIYTPYLKALQQSGLPIHGLAHITGGGIRNIDRISPSTTAVIDSFPDLSVVPPIFSTLKTRSRLSDQELRETFNMGVGMAVLTPKPQEVLSLMDDLGIQAWRIGHMRQD